MIGFMDIKANAGLYHLPVTAESRMSAFLRKGYQHHWGISR
jgi:hypothetical protein